jgi:hypothetical protein
MGPSVQESKQLQHSQHYTSNWLTQSQTSRLTDQSDSTANSPAHEQTAALLLPQTLGCMHSCWETLTGSLIHRYLLSLQQPLLEQLLLMNKQWAQLQCRSRRKGRKHKRQQWSLRPWPMGHNEQAERLTDPNRTNAELLPLQRMPAAKPLSQSLADIIQP